MDEPSLEALAAPHASVANKIRALAAAGVPRADIARFLGKRYQHVRNVLEDDSRKRAGGYTPGFADVSGVQEAAPYRTGTVDDRDFIDPRGPSSFWLRLKPDGSLPLPQSVAQALDVTPGRRVFAELKDGALVIISSDTAADRARELVRKYVPSGVSLVDDLIDDRRAEAQRALDER